MGGSQSNLAIKLDLSGKGIRDLELDTKQPRMLPTFPKLQTVNLSKNKISHIPDIIVADIKRSPLVVEHLQILNLAKNKFTEIPECLLLLVNLRSLDLSSNEIQKLPDEFVHNFYRLDELVLSDNQINRLPWQIKKLRALRLLYIDGNNIRYLPNSLGKLKLLEDFVYRPNPLDESYEKVSDDLESLIKFVSTQRVPAMYMDEAIRSLAQVETKEDALTEDARMVRSLLKYKEGLDALKAHTAKEFNSENLSFYEVVRDFRRRFNCKVEIRTGELIKDAKAIFEKHIAEHAIEQVNLPAEATAQCKKAFLDTFNFPKGINQWIFDEAFKASFDLMVRDTFQRFRLTPVGKELIGILLKIEEKKTSSRYKVVGKSRAIPAPSTPIVMPIPEIITAPPARPLSPSPQNRPSSSSFSSIMPGSRPSSNSVGANAQTSPGHQLVKVPASRELPKVLVAPRQDSSPHNSTDIAPTPPRLSLHSHSSSESLPIIPPPHPLSLHTHAHSSGNNPLLYPPTPASPYSPSNNGYTSTNSSTIYTSPNSPHRSPIYPTGSDADGSLHLNLKTSSGSFTPLAAGNSARGMRLSTTMAPAIKK